MRAIRIVCVLFHLHTITGYIPITESKEHHSKELLLKPAGGGFILEIPGRSYRGIESDIKGKRKIKKKIITSKELANSHHNKKVDHKTGYSDFSLKRLHNHHVQETDRVLQRNGTYVEKGIKRKIILDKNIKSIFEQKKKFVKKKKRTEDELRDAKPKTGKSKMRIKVRLKSNNSEGITNVSNNFESQNPNKTKALSQSRKRTTKTSFQNYSSFWSHISSLLLQHLHSSQSQEPDIFQPAEIRWEPKKINSKSGTIQIR